MSLPDFSGQTIARRYLLTSPLSSGGTSSVYDAIDKGHSKKYAIKCISKLNLNNKQLLLRTAEVFHHQMVTGCSPHVLPLHEIIDEDSYLFIVFDLCEGDLFDAIWGSRIYQRNDALIKQTFLDILDGVYACHMIGVFHRDLKPENILCTECGLDVQIADFGLATRKRICRDTRCGTPDYMGPEQWAEKIVYYPSLADIWSLGIILLNMVTGHRPWKAARVSDPQFRAFLDDGDYLYNTFAISRPLSEVLKWILCPNPLGRLQIPQIREAIVNMDTFYRLPWSPEKAALKRLEEVTLPVASEKNLPHRGVSGCSPDEKKRVRHRGCRPMPYCPGREDSFHELFRSDERAGMTQMELSLGLFGFSWWM